MCQFVLKQYISEQLGVPGGEHQAAKLSRLASTICHSSQTNECMEQKQMYPGVVEKAKKKKQ